jgi:prepilin-type N-terminal cleavage/methylation domain-containing protein
MSRLKIRISAFTLVELLVVVAILGILIALAIPALAKTIETAQSVQSTSNLRQLVTANMAYAAENGSYCPADNKANNMRWCAKKAGTKWDATLGYLSDYLGKSRRVTICPLFKDMLKGSFEEGTGGYGYNSSYVGGRPGGSYNADGSRKSARITEISRTDTVMFATSGYANGDSVQEYPFCEPPFWDFGDGPTDWRPSPSAHFRFNNKALVAWCDGRVTAETCDPREVGFNPHGGDANAQKLGWFGPDENNGFWNPKR